MIFRLRVPPNILARLVEIALAAVLVVTGSLHAAAQLAETWQTGYTGQDATGAHVLGYWQFKPDQPMADSSGRWSALTLAGAVAAADGKRDGALESFPGWPVEDKRHAAFAPSKPALSPKGAFTIEMWIKPKPQLEARLTPVHVDKKYVAHTDYQWRLTAADKGGARRMQVTLGFGDGSETFHSEPFAPGTEWQHLAFTYDGAGAVRFHRNGAPLGGGDKPGRGPIAPGKHLLSIGDRVGSNYAGFPGFIDEVRICDGVLEFRPVAVEFAMERKTWLRMEKAPPVRVLVRNLSKSPAKDLELRISLEGLGAKNFAVPELAARATHILAYPLRQRAAAGYLSAPRASGNARRDAVLERRKHRDNARRATAAQDAGGDVGPRLTGEREGGNAAAEGSRLHPLPRPGRRLRRDLGREEAGAAG
ncbi:MAG: LamG domain-containing protein [Verrucomicrobiota bacterium]|nr:LamG domain-containing protein [Verrucomicrobiota bacterium]